MVTKCDQKPISGKKMKPVIKAVVLNKQKKITVSTESLEGLFGCPPADI